jgi:two-component system cell cycle sensor histidine kinase/response regulator CckA
MRDTSPVVLMAEDESMIRQMARRILEARGYSVLEAADGVEAVKILASAAKVDLLMADLEMPNLAGEEMVRQCRITHPDLKVLYVSGVVDRLLDHRPTLWEGEAFLDKPFTPNGLIEAVNLLVYGSLVKPAAGRLQ